MIETRDYKFKRAKKQWTSGGMNDIRQIQIYIHVFYMCKTLCMVREIIQWLEYQAVLKIPRWDIECTNAKSHYRKIPRRYLLISHKKLNMCTPDLRNLPIHYIFLCRYSNVVLGRRILNNPPICLSVLIFKTLIPGLTIYSQNQVFMVI